MTGLLDTSVFVAAEQQRPLGPLPDEAYISVATTAELHLGVLMAQDDAVRAARLRTMGEVRRRFVELPITSEIAAVFAEVVAPLKKAGRKLSVMDAFIAATAIAHELPVYTQDHGFRHISGVEVRLV